MESTPGTATPVRRGPHLYPPPLVAHARWAVCPTDVQSLTRGTDRAIDAQDAPLTS